MPKNRFKKIGLEKLKWIAQHPFLVSLILILTALIIGGIVFYKYDVLVKKLPPEIEQAPLQFKKTLYQNILTEWESREERFESAETKEYPDPFQPK